MSRYIDADEFEDELYEHEFSNWCDKDEVSELIDNMPSADVEPVRHGYWFKDEKFYHDIMVDGNPVCLYHTCSVCGVADEYITVDERPNGTHVILKHVRKYCPNCGARMEKEWGGPRE